MEWLTHALTGLLSAASVIGFAKAWAYVYSTKHKLKRIDVDTAVAVLTKTVAELRKDRDEVRLELNDLRSEHSACLIEQQRLRSENEHLAQRVEALEKRVAHTPS